MAVDPIATTTLYAGDGYYYNTGRVYKITNGGNSWVATSQSGISVSCLCIDPLTPTKIYAGTFDKGIYYYNYQ